MRNEVEEIRCLIYSEMVDLGRKIDALDEEIYVCQHDLYSKCYDFKKTRKAFNKVKNEKKKLIKIYKEAEEKLMNKLADLICEGK